MAVRPQRVSGQPASGAGTLRPRAAATSTPAPPAVEDDVLQNKVDMIAEGELDRDDNSEPAAGSVEAPARGATSVICCRARTSGAPTQATADSHTSAQIIKLAKAGGPGSAYCPPCAIPFLGRVLAGRRSQGFDSSGRDPFWPYTHCSIARG